MLSKGFQENAIIEIAMLTKSFRKLNECVGAQIKSSEMILINFN